MNIDVTENVPVFSRRVQNDVSVTDWVFFGFFKGTAELGLYLETRLSSEYFRQQQPNHLMVQQEDGKFQFIFVYDWTPGMLDKKFPPYSL